MFFKEFPLPKKFELPALTVNIRDFGIEDGSRITKAVERAIEYVAQNGGGRVVIPEGNWISGKIHLKSNLELHFEKGAVVKFDPTPEEYLPIVFTVYGGIRCYNYSSLIYGIGLENVALTGQGELDGSGEEWWKWAKNLTAREILYHAGLPVEQRRFGTPEYGLRPMFLQIIESKNVLIEGLKFTNSPCWTVNTVWCTDVTVRGVTVENPEISPNTDGVNIESCNRALVEDCTVVSGGDDMFCIKAGRNEDAWEVGIPCENVIIRRCKSLMPSKSGGIVIGSEMSAGVRNILAEDCDFAHNINCIRIKSKDGRGGFVENVDYKNIHMKKGMRGINLSYRYSCEATDDAKEPGKYMPVLRNISFENITCDDVDDGISIDGIPGGVMENIHFKSIAMKAKKCLSADSVNGLYMCDVKLEEL
jgi:polygalacturonase